LKVEGHWQMNDVPCGIHVPPFWQGFGWHGVGASKNNVIEMKKKCLNYVPGASQRFPVNVSGQLQTNPAPKGTHWPPLRPNDDYF
jgi:hypothetical protein